MNSFTEQTLTCADCGVQFAFTVAEQEFFAEKGFTNSPRRCKTCRSEAKAARRGGGGRGGYGGGGGGYGGDGHGGGGYGGGRSGPREMFDAVCSACGVSTQVPFKPTGAKPVYCRECFRR
jgi:CxxC-x17-CxxC domain-containing protein